MILVISFPKAMKPRTFLEPLQAWSGLENAPLDAVLTGILMGRIISVSRDRIGLEIHGKIGDEAFFLAEAETWVSAVSYASFRK